MPIRRDTLGTPLLGTGIGFNISTGEFGTEFSKVNKFGLAESVGTAFQTLWTGTNSLYVYPAVAAVMKVSAVNSFDHCNSGQGAHTVKITGLNASYVEVSETVSLTGQDAVTTTTEFLRVYRAQVMTAGSSLTNLGPIWIGTGTVTAGVPAVKHSHIYSVRAQSLQSFYTVPASYNACLVSIYASVAQGKAIDLELYARPFGGVFNIKEHHNVYQGILDRKYEVMNCFTPKTDLELRVTGAASATDVSGTFDLILYPA